MAGMKDVLDDDPTKNNLKRRQDELRQLGTGEEPTKKAAAKAMGSPSVAPPADAPTKYNTPRKSGESMDDYTARMAAARAAYSSKGGKLGSGD